MKQRKLVYALLGFLALICVQQVRTLGNPSQPPLSSTLQRQLDQQEPQIVNITDPAAIHGWVKKAGPLDPLHWHNDWEKERRNLFNSWHEAWRSRKKRRVQLEQGGQAVNKWLPDPPPAIFPACRVFVNHRYKFIYIRQTKTGSTSLVRYLTECESSDAGPACLDILPSNTSHAKLQRLFSDYFVFTVVRNPFMRALSSYKFLLTRMRAEPPSCTEGLGWEAFCSDPMALGLRCRKRPGCCVRSAGLFWAHTVEQGRCVMAEGGSGWAVDFIGRTERMEDDVTEILKEIDRRRDPGMPALSGGMGVSNGLQHFKTARSCAEGGARLEPFERMAGPTADNFLAAVPKEQYCDEWEYFSRHEECVPALQHFLWRDLQLFYGEAARGAAVVPAEAAS